MKTVIDFYPFDSEDDRLYFSFESIGENGVFEMAIMFQETLPGRFNLALCVVQDGEFLDDVTTDNNDFSKILSTVAVALREFFEFYPDAIVEIAASDDKRLRVYNGIFRRRRLEIQALYLVEGIAKGTQEPYNPENFYNLFVIRLRRS